MSHAFNESKKSNFKVLNLGNEIIVELLVNDIFDPKAWKLLIFIKN